MLDNNGLSDEHETPLQSDMVTWSGSFSRGDTWEISNKSVFSFQLQFSLNSTWCVCGVLILFRNGSSILENIFHKSAFNYEFL